MNRIIFSGVLKKVLFAFGLLFLLAGCASVDFEQSLADTNKLAAEFTRGQLSLAQTAEQRDALANIAAELLQKPVAQADAVKLALANSPTFQQGMLAQNWASAANAAQGGRIAQPYFPGNRFPEYARA
ncbi:MAG: hypothetical protein WC236_09240 [Gallionellaceae bacterium]